MLDVSENFLEFFVDESCGQCTPCREGIPKLLGRRANCCSTGRCSMDYLKELCGLGETMQLAVEVRAGPIGPQRLLVDRRTFPGRDPRPRRTRRRRIAKTEDC